MCQIFSDKKEKHLTVTLLCAEPLNIINLSLKKTILSKYLSHSLTANHRWLFWKQTCMWQNTHVRHVRHWPFNTLVVSWMKPERMSSMPQLLDVDLLWVQEETQYTLWNISCDGLAWGTQHWAWHNTKGSQGKLWIMMKIKSGTFSCKLVLCQFIMSLIRNLMDGPQLKQQC